MKTVAMQARLGITAIAALTILTLPTWAQEKGGQGAKPGTSHCDCPSHAITLPLEKKYSDGLCDRTRSAKPGGTLSPLDLLVLHNEHVAKSQRQSWGAVASQSADPLRVSIPSRTATPWDTRFTRRYLSPSANFLGNEVWIRTTQYPGGLRKVAVRNSFGQPLRWGVEEDTRFFHRLHAVD